MKKRLQRNPMESYDGADDLCIGNRSACNSGSDCYRSHQRSVDCYSRLFSEVLSSGPSALKALHRVTTYGQRGKFLPRHLHYTRIVHPTSSEVLDTSALCTFMPQPSTATGAHSLFLCVDSLQCRRRCCRTARTRRQRCHHSDTRSARTTERLATGDCRRIHAAVGSSL